MRSRRAGFTLMELMIVVTIVGILAAIAVPAFVGQMRRSQMLDAYRMLDDMKRAEATYFAHFSQYCAVGWNPAATPTGTDGTGFDASDPAWQILGVNPDGPQRFQYRVLPFAPGAAVPPGFGAAPTDDFWYIAQAQGDLDGDGTTVFVETYSHGERFYVGRGLNGPFLPQGWE